MATIIRVQGNRLELAIPLQTVTMTPNGKVTEDYNVPADAEVKVLLSSSWKTYGFEPLSISGNVVTMRDDGKLPAGKYAVEVRIRQADGTPLRSKYCNIIDIRDCNDGVTQEYDDFIEGSVTLDAQIFWFAKGDDGITPHIDETTGNWFIGDEDTGVHAQGEAGTTDYNELDNKPDLSVYVEKEQGKGLSTNDFTNEEKSKVDSAYQKPASGIPASDIANGVIPDVSQFITKSVDDLLNYYLKSETYTKAEVQALIGAIQQFHYEVYASTSDVTSPANNVLYLIGPTGSGTDKYEEYVYDSTKQDPWIKIGDTSIDLSGYVTTVALNTALADYTTTADLTTLLSGKQDTISDLSTIRSGAQAGATAYQKPAGGIPKSDLAQGVKDSLDLADSAIQEDTLYEDANGHDYVEIAGMKWATKNIGADAVTDAGLYFQWGDTQGYTAEQVGTEEGQKAFTWADYKFSSDAEGTSMTKYNNTDGKTVLDLEDDAARANWGGSWRMPTTEEMQAFGAAVNAVWTNDYNNTGVAGLVCTDKTDNTKVVFFPAAGGCGRGIVRGVGSYGICWSSSLNSDSIEDSFQLDFNDVGADWSSEHIRFYGYSIRPILDTTQLKKDLDSKQDKPLVIEVNYDDTSVPNGTYDAIAAAVAAGKEVKVIMTTEIDKEYYPLAQGPITGADAFYFMKAIARNVCCVEINSDSSIRYLIFSLADSSHIHGSITNDGKISSDTAVANGDKLVITDNSDSSKVKRSSISFDGSTTNKALTPKGTWEDIPAAQVNSDWNAESGVAKILNKPTIPTVPTISTDIDTDGNDDTKTASPKAVKTFVEGKGYLTQHQDISGKANKSEMSVVDGTGANADKTTITLKSGTSATVLKSHQSLSGKQDVIDSSHKLSADLVDDTNTTNKFTNATEKQTWNGKQDALVSGTNIKTINNESVLGSGNINIDISGKEDVTTIVAPVNETDATLPITTLTCEVGKYYRIDVAVDTLAITLPAVTDLTTVRTVVLYLTAGTTPAVTISSTAVSGGTAPDVYYQDGFEIKAGNTYEINALWNGLAWIVASVEIVTNNGE